MTKRPPKQPKSTKNNIKLRVVLSVYLMEYLICHFHHYNGHKIFKTRNFQTSCKNNPKITLFSSVFSKTVKVEKGENRDLTQLRMANTFQFMEFIRYDVRIIIQTKKRAKSVNDCLIVLKETECHMGIMLNSHSSASFLHSSCFQI